MEKVFFPLNVAKMSISQEFESRLQRVLRRVYSDRTELRAAERLSGGASQETWLIRLAGENAPPELILRRAPEGMAGPSDSTAIGLANEASLIKDAEGAGVPVPKVVHVLDEEDALGEGFFMSRIHGETIARRILRDEAYAQARKDLPAQCGKALAGIHSISSEGHGALQTSSGLDQIAHYEAIYQSTGACRPIFDLAMVWLRENLPPPVPPVLVHGDFRLGNIMVDGEGLAAVLDWELAHLGDPREDIGWMCTNSWRFGQSEKRLGGFGDVEELLSAYEAAGGQALAPRDIDWWEMLGSMKWGVMCMLMYDSFRTGLDSSVERAAIGRRISETEIDLVNLLEAQRHA